MRRYFQAIVSTVMLATFCCSAFSQSYPQRAVKLIVPAAPGDPTDLTARIVARELSRIWQQPVVIENIVGASGLVGADAAARANPDAHTLLIANNSLPTNATLFSKAAIDPVKQFSSVGGIAASPLVLMVNPSLPTNSLQDFVALAKSKELNYATPGTGSTQHLCGQAFTQATGARMLHIPYKGTAPAMSAIVGGDVQFVFGNMVAALPQIKAGKLKAIAVMSNQRSPLLPEVPSVGETLPNLGCTQWQALFAPARTPTSLVSQVSADLRRALNSEEVRQSLAALGLQPLSLNPAEMQGYLQAETSKWASVIKSASMHVDGGGSTGGGGSGGGGSGGGGSGGGGSGGGGVGGGGGKPKPKANATLVEVLFGTDRLPTGLTDPNRYFGTASGEFSYGISYVSIPSVHERGVLERPSLWRLEFRENPKKHFVLERVESQSHPSFFKGLQNRLANSNKDRLLVFVHGFNTSFADAALRTAQLSFDLEFQGVPVLYSWPTLESEDPRAYAADEATIQISGVRLANFLDEILNRTGAKEVFLVAHSMGNQALANAFIQIVDRSANARQRIKELVLIAPDIDRAVFTEVIAPKLASAGAPVTLYASRDDLALVLSRGLRGGKVRLGDLLNGPFLASYIDTIDASGTDTSLAKHSYYMTQDLFYLINYRYRADKRYLVRVPVGDKNMWRIPTK